jgi:hypothetical protein
MATTSSNRTPEIEHARRISQDAIAALTVYQRGGDPNDLLENIINDAKYLHEHNQRTRNDIKIPVPAPTSEFSIPRDIVTPATPKFDNVDDECTDIKVGITKFKEKFGFDKVRYKQFRVYFILMVPG